jgi:hypothetical protein
MNPGNNMQHPSEQCEDESGRGARHLLANVWQKGHRVSWQEKGERTEVSQSRDR